MADRDNYRFYLGNWDRIRLTLESPPGGEIVANLYWDTKIFKQFKPAHKVVLEGPFPPATIALNSRLEKPVRPNTNSASSDSIASAVRPIANRMTILTLPIYFRPMASSRAGLSGVILIFMCCLFSTSRPR